MRHATISSRLVPGRHRSRGIAAVEFAIVAPLLLFTMLATAEIGRAFVHYHTLSYAVRNCTRYLSQHAIDGTTGVVSITDATRARVRNLAVYANVAGAGTRVLPNLQLDDISVGSSGDDVVVSVDYAYQPMIGPWLPTFGSGDDVPLALGMHVDVTMRAIS